MNPFRSSVSYPAFLLVALTLLLGCSKGEVITNPPPPQPKKSLTTIIHTSPRTPGLDISVDGTQKITNLQYLHDALLIFQEGERNIQGNLSGTATTVFNLDGTFSNQDHLLFIINSDDSLTARFLDDTYAPENPGSVTNVRLINLIPDASGITVELRGKKSEHFFGHIPYKNATQFTPMEIDVFDHLGPPYDSLTVTVTDIDRAQGSDILLTENVVAFPNGSYTIAVTGSRADDTYALKVIERSRVAILH